HRATGFIITAYSAQSGPSYGGGPRYPEGSQRPFDAAAADELDRIAARLDALVSAARPVDWETTRYVSDYPTVYRVGGKGGDAFREELPVAAGLEYLLAQAERGDAPAKDTRGNRVADPDERAVTYWIQRSLDGERLDGALPRVRKAWQRAVAKIPGEPLEMRE